MQSTPSTTTTNAWWLPRDVPDQQRLSCAFGPLNLDIFRDSGEWRLSWSYDDELDVSSRVSMEVVDGMAESETFERYVFGGGSGRVQLRPLLMERPVVIRPREPVFLPSGEQTTLYLSTPLCLQVEVGEPAVVLRELPMVRLSDTWFGPSTREGELCYSGRTHARHSISEVPRRPHRAVTPLRIHNAAPAVLPLEKVSVPVPVLSVYGQRDGHLWTQGVSLKRSTDTDLAALQVHRGAPAYAKDATLLSGPRQEAERGGLVRAFSVLFGT